jgi:hypothetical protein
MFIKVYYHKSNDDAFTLNVPFRNLPHNLHDTRDGVVNIGLL